MTLKVNLKTAVKITVIWQCLVVSLIELISSSKRSSQTLTRNFLVLRNGRIWTRQNLGEVAVKFLIFLLRKQTLLSAWLWTLHTDFG
jgi:hypothetical protein